MIGVGSILISLFLVLVCYSLTLTAKRADENLLMICEQNQKIEEEKGKQEMESKRDILRVIEKEIKKGSAPVAFAGLGFPEECYHLVDSQAKMNQLLDYFFRNEEYAALADRQVKSNIYAEMGKRLNFRSARSDRDRKNMEVTAKRWIKKKHPTFDGDVYVENIRCFLDISKEELEEVINEFQYEGKLVFIKPYGSGHINDTFLLKYEIGYMGSLNVILQRMNRGIFEKPVELMENVIGVTEHLKKKIVEMGGDPERETLNLIPAKNGKKYVIDSQGEYWRSYIYITDATSYDKVEKPEDFYESAVAFGKFQGLLSDYPAESLHDTIRGFHDTKARFLAFQNAVEKDICGRKASVKKEIEFVLEHEKLTTVFDTLIRKGEIPLRVTHNDTKLNNVMIDDKTGKGICVIDLDTIMPGLAMNDFGDSIRFGASTAAEDEIDLTKVSCDMNLYEIYLRGFLKGCNGKLTSKEMELLPFGAKVMTFECGMRFLTDYLEGDHYFKIHRENHNLDRCRTQFKLVEDMENKWEIMQKITEKYRRMYKQEKSDYFGY